MGEEPKRRQEAALREIWAGAPPLIPFVLCLMAGIALDRLLHPGLVWAAATAAAGIVLLKRPPAGALLIGLALGLLTHHIHRVPLSNADARHVFGGRPADVEVEGRIAGDPLACRDSRGTRVEFPLRLSARWEGEERMPFRGTVWVRWIVEKADVPAQRFFWGDRVRLSGRIGPPPESSNPFLFDPRFYLETQGIHHVLEVDDGGVERIGDSSAPVVFLFRARDRLDQAVLRGVQGGPEVDGLIRGMVLGERAEMDPSVTEHFRRTGTLHVVAISGLHITLIAFIFTFVLRLLRLPRGAIVATVLPLLLAYVVMTGFRASAVRSWIMCAVVMVGWVLNRPSHLMNSLAVSALLILLFAPYQLFDAGFQLSFLVVAAIVLVAPRIQRSLEPWYEIDPLVPRGLVVGWRLRLHGACGRLSDLVSVSAAAWAGSAALILHDFHLLSFSALWCNLIVVPLSSLSLCLGFTVMALDLVWPGAAALVNQTQWLVVRMMLAVTEAGSAGGGHLNVAEPPVWAVVAFYGAGWLFLVWKKSRPWIAGVVAGSALAAVVWSLAGAGTMRATVLDVKAGQAILIEQAWGSKILVDAGSESDGRRVVEPFLRARGIGRLDAAIATHGDAAHVGGLLEILGRLPVGELVVSRARARSPKYKKLLELARRLEVPVREVSAGDEVVHGALRLKVLWPEPPYGRRADQNCLVLQCDGLLLLSDLPGEMEGRIRPEGVCQVVRGAGGQEQFSGLLDRTEAAIYSASDRFQDDVVAPEIESRLRDAAVPMWVTGRHGAVVVQWNQKGRNIRPVRSSPKPVQAP